MEDKIRLSIVAGVLALLFLFVALPGTVFALGEYDGVWVGPETVEVSGTELLNETTGTVIYQEEGTLSLWDPLLGSIDLIPSGSQWVLPSDLPTTYAGISVTITSFVLRFDSRDHLTGTITAEGGSGVVATGSLSHTRQSCQTLTNGTTISGLSGAEGSLRCYEINLPTGATNLDVQTEDGTGNCDLIQVYHRPDFEYYTSENPYNQEQIFVPFPSSGIWYLGLGTLEGYSGLNLTVTYDGFPVPVASYTADILEGTVPLTVNFTDQSTGSLTSWEWDFGDGTMSNDQNPDHIYSEPGEYTVTLTVTGPGGTDVETKTAYIVAREIKAMPWVPLLLLGNGE